VYTYCSKHHSTIVLHSSNQTNPIQSALTTMAPINVETEARNIVVSGGARGIGRALSRMFLEGGHKGSEQQSNCT
jgi:hypothetical protein